MSATGLTPEFQRGALVRYYLEGWRYGHLEGVKKAIATIRPVAAYGGTVRFPVRVPVTDIRSTP